MGELSLVILLQESVLKTQCPIILFAMLDVNLIVSVQDICSGPLPPFIQLLRNGQRLHTGAIQRFGFILTIAQ